MEKSEEKPESDKSRLASRFLGLLAWVALAWVVGKYMTHFIHDPDIWWHLASGRTMVDNFQLLREDIFSHTLTNTLWVNFEWLSQIIMYSLMNWFGLTGLFNVKVILGLICMVVLVLCLREAGAKGPLLWLLTWLGFHILKVRLCTRVELATLILAPLFVLIHLKARKSERNQPLFLSFVLFPIMVLWTNMHGGFIYGLGLVVLFALGDIWQKGRNTFSKSSILAAIFLIVAALFNPYGPKIFKVLIEHLIFLSQGFPYIEEWEAPAVKSTPYFWVCYFLAGGLLVKGILKKNRSFLFWTPAVVAFAVWGGMSLRNTALFAFVALPFVAHALKDMKWLTMPIGSINFRNILDKGGPSVRSLSRILAPGIWVLCFLLLIIDKDYFTMPLPPGKVNWGAYPVRACRFVQEKGIEGNMFNPMGFGGYIGWALGPERKIFMDGRYIFYPLVTEVENLKNGKTAPLTENTWTSFFDKYSVNYAIQNYDPLRLGKEGADPLYHKSILDLMYPNDKWALVFWDDTSLVFLKRTDQYKKIIDQFEYTALWPYNPEKTFVLLKTGRVSADKASEEMIRHEHETGNSFRGKQMRYVLSRA